MRPQTMATPEGLTRLIKTCVVGRVGGELLPNHFYPESTYSDDENTQYGRYIAGLRRDIDLCLKSNGIDITIEKSPEVKPGSDLFGLVFELAKYANALALKNKGLIPFVLRDFDNGYNTDQDLEDLRQEGWEKGLFKAAIAYDPDYNKPSPIPYKFTTLAVPYIKGAMLNALNKLETIRLPENVFYELVQFQEVRQTLTQNLNRNPTEHEVIVYMFLENIMQRVPTQSELETYIDTLRKGDIAATEKYQKYKKRIKQARKARETRSLSETSMISFRDTTGEWITDDFGKAGDDFTNILVDPESQSPEELVIKKMLQGEITRAFALLGSKQREVLILRLGLGEGGYTHTLMEAGESLGITHERVRQIEDKALRKLRAPTIQGRRLRDYR